ncbi:MAG TPA: flagellar hook-basal body complex protein [Anaerolineales bacterium]|nr:flagellar hook-basal body complex protein [Anaerolineales bacterium]
MPTLSTSSLLVASRTALLAKMLGVDMVSQNLANVNTYGYRGQRMNFQELLNDRTNINGVQPVATQILLAPGRLETTGRSLDLAVDGDGFFPIQLPDGRTAYTRDGQFTRDADNNLVTGDGYRLIWQGQIPPNTPDERITVNRDGTVEVLQDDGTLAQIGQIGLVRFTNPTGLIGYGRNLFLESVPSGAPVAGNPGAAGFGSINGGALEGSNVNMASEMTNLIALQRAYSLSTRAFQQVDTMIGLAVQMRRG